MLKNGGNPKNAYLYSLTLPSYIILPLSAVCFLPNMPKSKPNEMSSGESSYNCGNKKCISLIPASVSDGHPQVIMMKSGPFGSIGE